MDNNNMEVKEFVEKVEVMPTTDEETIAPEETENSPESSQEKQEGGEIEPETEEVEQPLGEQEDSGEIKDIDGETPREKALRLEVTRLKREANKQRRDELFVSKEPTKRNEALEQYDPTQVAELKKVLAAAADELGFVKKDEITSSKRDEIFEDFMDKHPEYSVEKDPDGLLFGQLKAEFGLYKEPTSAKEFQRLLNKSHDTIFKPASLNLNKINAQREKAKVASHTGNTAGIKSKPQRTVSPNLRLDALHGFSEEDMNDIFAG